MYFSIKKSGTQYMFNGHGENHEVVLTSERYITKASAQNAINVIKAGAASAAVYDQA